MSTQVKQLSAEQRREVRSLVADSGYSRAEALAWVRVFAASTLPNGPGRVGKAPR